MSSRSCVAAFHFNVGFLSIVIGFVNSDLHFVRTRLKNVRNQRLSVPVSLSWGAPAKTGIFKSKS